MCRPRKHALHTVLVEAVWVHQHLYVTIAHACHTGPEQLAVRGNNGLTGSIAALLRLILGGLGRGGGRGRGAGIG